MNERLPARQRLGKLGITTPKSLALWARRKGLLSVYVEFCRKGAVVPAHWRVVRPGYVLTPGPAWQAGTKVFMVYSNAQKATAEIHARQWAAVRYRIPAAQWVRIEGMGSALFPLPVVRAINAALGEGNEVRYSAQRQQDRHQLTDRKPTDYADVSEAVTASDLLG